MKKTLNYILIFILLALSFGCKEEDPYDYEIRYADGYPNVMAGIWKVVDYDREQYPLSYNTYDLIIAVDPANTDRMIIDNIYNSNLRVRTFVDKARQQYYITKGEQLEKNSALYDVKTISLRGDYGFNTEADNDFIILQVGLYDEYNDLFDSIIIAGYRKTGFEDIKEYEFDFIFD